jgi:hypothetical protein
MLQRVVEKRSGDRFPSGTVSGVTGAQHVIYVIRRQAKKRVGQWPSGFGCLVRRSLGEAGRLQASAHFLTNNPESSIEHRCHASSLLFSGIWEAKFPEKCGFILDYVEQFTMAGSGTAKGTARLHSEQAAFSFETL